jgi:hypothetical protein
LSGIGRGCGLLALLVLAAVGANTGGRAAEGRRTSFLAPSEIRPGMRGIARTVFAGSESQEFAVELLGVVSGTRPKGDLILFRALGDTLARTGVVAGMSGSPVYVDGRLVGAISFSYPFSKEPIGMITPIAEMLEGIGRVDEPPSPWLGMSSGLFEPLRQSFMSRSVDPELWERLFPAVESQSGLAPLIALWASGGRP